MLVYIWMCVMLQAFAPGGDRLANHYVNAMQSSVRAQIEMIDAAPAARPKPTQRVRQMRTAASRAR